MYHYFDFFEQKGKPLQIGDVVQVSIDSLSSSGNGVGFYQADTKRAIFVPYTAPGDVITAKITGQTKAYFSANLEKIITPSTHRIEPVCPHFGVCGACDWLHIDYDEQIKQKKGMLEHALNKKKIVVDSLEVFPAYDKLNYRYKVRFPGDGFSAKHSNEIVKIKECHILHKSFEKIIPLTHTAGECWGYDETKQEVQQETASYSVGGKQLLYDPAGFVQSNFALNRKLVGYVASLVGKEKEILELYAGNGNFTLSVASKSKKVTAVEGLASACRLLTQNLRNNQVKNVKVIEQDARGFLLEHGRRYRQRSKSLRQTYRKPTPIFDHTILDPPRGGVGNSIRHAGEISHSIIYVSCDPDSACSDMKILVEKGWGVTSVALFDMFPQTKHYEIVAFLTRL